MYASLLSTNSKLEFKYFPVLESIIINPAPDIALLSNESYLYIPNPTVTGGGGSGVSGVSGVFGTSVTWFNVTLTPFV